MILSSDDKHPLMTRLFGVALLGFFLFFYLLFNPFWFGDAPWYAADIALKRYPVDAGHLFWRPLGGALTALLPSFGFPPDPLRALAFVSAVLSAASIPVFLGCLRRLGIGRHTAILASSTFGFSQALLVYGASGASYGASLFFIVLALYLATSLSPTPLQAIAIWFSLLAASSLWLLSVLALPGIFIIDAWRRSKPPMSNARVIRLAARRACIPAALIAVFLYTAYLSQNSLSQTFLAWLSSSTHAISPALSVMNILRAALGAVAVLLPTGVLGAAIRELYSTGDVSTLLQPAALIPLLICIIISLAFVAYPSRRAPSRSLPSVSLLFLALLPNTLFAMMWQGSDIERFLPTIPFIILVIVRLYGEVPDKVLSRRLHVLHLVLIGQISGFLFFVFIPGMVRSQQVLDLSSELHATAAPRLTILDGRDFPAPFWAPLSWFGATEVLHLGYELPTVSTLQSSNPPSSIFVLGPLVGFSSSSSPSSNHPPSTTLPPALREQISKNYTPIGAHWIQGWPFVHYCLNSRLREGTCFASR